MIDRTLLDQVLQHPKIRGGLTNERAPNGDAIAWCIFHDDGHGKPPHEPNLRIGPKGYYCAACKAKGGLRELARHLGIGLNKQAKQLVRTWTYYGPDGATAVFRKDRFQMPDGGKTYGLRRAAPPDWQECIHRAECQKQRRDCFDGSIWSLKEKPCSPAPPHVLYNQPMLGVTPDRVAHLPEGEQCCDALAELGYTALCNPYGAGEWRHEYAEALHSWVVVIWVDADGAGRDHGQLVARSLRGVATSTKVIDLHPDRTDGSDIADWIAERKAAGGDAESIRAALEALIAQAPEWQPTQVVSAAATPPLSSAETSVGARLFLTPAELSSGGGSDDADWLWRGLLATGHITLIAGKPRASGKSTLTFGLLGALLLDQEAFLGFAVRPLRGAVVLSEETPHTLLDKVRLFGLSHCRQLLIAPRHTTARLSWEEVIAAGVEEAKRSEAELLVCDSFPHFAKLPKDGAKDASLIAEVFRPLQAATAEGLAVWLIHQERKGGGEAGEGVRDSGAIIADSDIILELGRLDGAQSRKMGVMSRFRSSPSDFAFSFDKETGLYTPLGSVEEHQGGRKEQDRERAVREIADLLPTGTGLTQKDVTEKARTGRSQASAVLNRAVETGLAVRSGAGTRSDPYRYSRPNVAASGPSRPDQSPDAAIRRSGVSADGLQCRDRRKQTAGRGGGTPTDSLPLPEGGGCDCHGDPPAVGGR